MIYLASPYSHPDPAVREARFLLAAGAAARLLAAGLPAFSPVAHTHPVALAGELPTGWDFWRDFDRWFIERCDALLVVTVCGWRESRGVAAEIDLAASAGRPVGYAELGNEAEAARKLLGLEVNTCKATGATSSPPTTRT